MQDNRLLDDALGQEVINYFHSIERMSAYAEVYEQWLDRYREVILIGTNVPFSTASEWGWYGQWGAYGIHWATYKRSTKIQNVARSLWTYLS